MLYIIIHGSKAYYISWAIYLSLRVSWVRFTHPTHVQELGPILLKYCSRASHHTSHTARNSPWAPRRKVSLSPNSPTTPWQRKNSVLLPDKGAGGVDHDERTRTATHSHAQPGSRAAGQPTPRSPAPQRRDARAAARSEGGLPAGCSHHLRPAAACSGLTIRARAQYKAPLAPGARLRCACPLFLSRGATPGSPRAPVPLRRPERRDPADPIEIHGRIQAGPPPAPGGDQFSPWYGISDSLHPIAVHPFFQALQSCAWTAASRRSCSL